MEAKLPSAVDVKQTFLEKVQDPKFVFLISFLILYLDAAGFVTTGKNLLAFQFSEIGKSIPVGALLLAILPYFLILYGSTIVRPKIARLRFSFKGPRSEDSIKEILEELPKKLTQEQKEQRDWRYVSLAALLEYALVRNEKVLYDFVLSVWEKQREHENLESLRFSFWLLAFVEVLLPGLVLHDLIFQTDPALAWILYLALAVGFSFLFIRTLSLRSYKETRVPLPDHPLGKKMEEDIRAELEQSSKDLQATMPNYATRPGSPPDA